MIRIVIADDQQLVRDGLQAILSVEPDLAVVASVPDGRAAVRAVVDHAPDVVLMDIRMPELDGLAATRELMARRDPPHVLVLTTFDLDEYVFEAMRAGAAGFLLKDAPRGRLTEAIRTVAGGETLLDPQLTRRLVEKFVRRPHVRPAPADLTAREREVLVQIARGLSNSEIAARLVISETTVKTHVASILRKGGMRDRAQAVILAYETGLVEPGTADA